MKVNNFMFLMSYPEPRDTVSLSTIFRIYTTLTCRNHYATTIPVKMEEVAVLIRTLHLAM